MSVKNRIIKYDLVNWHDLKPFQPDNFKKNERVKIDKLVKSYKQSGKITPFAVWETAEGLFVIDGHATLEVFKIIEAEGGEVETMQPAIWLEIKNTEEAKKFVLIYNSRYRDINESSLKVFIGDMDVEDLIGSVQLDVDLKKLFAEKLEHELPKYPIVPKFSEKYHAVIIVVDNDINFVNLIEKLGLETMQSYKTNRIGMTKIISYEQFDAKWKS